MIRLGLAVGVACFLWGRANSAYGWGDEAHQIVCEIAFQEVSAATREKIRGLVAQDEKFATFAASCVWPDHPRRRASEHFVNLPRTAPDVHSATCPTAATCLFTAIETDSKILKSPNVAAADKLASLKYLGHWVGDIHQPLHVSYRDDRGGNEIKSHGRCSSNLHSDWDTCIVKKRGMTESCGSWSP
jgi:hypothetical protein